ncbi:MAG: PAS domain S-box protein, partial [Holophaga sp.]
MSLDQASDLDRGMFSMLEQLPLPTWVSGSDGQCVFFNKALRDYVGLDQAQVRGNGWLQAIHPEDLASAQAHYLAAFQGRQSYTADFRVKRHDGVYRWVRDQGAAYFEGDGLFLGFMGNCIDITELHDIAAQRALEDALRASEGQFRALAEIAPVGIYLTNPEGQCLYANPQWCRMAGLSLEAALGMGWINGLHPEDRARVFSHWQRMVESKGQWGLEYRFMDKAGTITHVFGTAAPQIDASGAIIRYVGVNLDLSDTKRVEASRQAAEQRYQSLFQNLLEGCLHGLVLYRDAEPKDFLFLDANQALETLTGWKDMTGRKASEVIPGIHEANPEFLALFARVATTGHPERLELHLESLGIWVSITVHCSEPGYFVALFEDITRRRREQLLDRESETLAGKAQMAAYVAHEINGPLAGIKSAFTLLQTAIPKEHTFRPYVELVDREIDRITAIVRMMYELYRPSEPQAQNVSVATLLQDIATLLGPRFRSHQVNLMLDPGEPGLRGTLHANLLRQVIFNLLQNAIEATPRQGLIRCCARRDSEVLEIQVSDAGPGVPP